MTSHNIIYREGFASRTSAEYALFSKARMLQAHAFISETLDRLGSVASLEGTHLASTCVPTKEGSGWDLVIQGRYEITP